MNKKEEIQKLKNQIKANEYTIEKNPGRFEDLNFDNDKMRKQIEELEKKPTKSRKVIANDEVRDSGDNCLAIQKDGKQCQCKRVFGNYCRRHESHYIEELEGKNDD